MKRTIIQELDYVIEFTALYKSESDIYLREAKCIKLQSVNMLALINEDDLITGGMNYRFVGFSTQVGGLYTYFFHEDQVFAALCEVKRNLNKEYVDKLEGCINFWKKEKTMNRVKERFNNMGCIIGEGYTEPGIGNSGVRIAGSNVDLDKLVRLGIPGLYEEINKHAVQDPSNNFYVGLKVAVDTIVDACKYYELEALELYKKTGKESLKRLSTVLKNIQVSKPQSFHEAIQLVWVYGVISDLMNFGRMDVYLGDFYVRDIKNGTLTEDDTIDILTSMYRLMMTVHKIHDTRVIIGGVGRRNEKNADELAIVIMEVSRRFKDVVPQLTMRYYKGMDERVYDKALKVNAEGTTFPIIYSDNTNVPAVMKVYNVTKEEAERYLPFGCGEYVLEGLSLGTPNNGINLLKCLEVTLHNGFDPYWKMQLGFKTGTAEELNTFEKLWEAYKFQLFPVVDKTALMTFLNYDVAGEQAGFLHLSLLMDDCIERGKDVLNGGIRYLNAASEIFGIMSCVDSLTAIKKLVYDDKKYTLRELITAMDKNFEGCEELRQDLLSSPKYGNDNDYADDMAKLVFNNIADFTIEAGEKYKINKYNIVSVNNSMSAEWGCYCMASACGRYAGSPLSNANGASIGADKNGITALLNSMGKIEPEKHVGVINNVRFTKELFASSYEKVKAVLRTFYENGGVQTNISVVGRDDLENALKNPEHYPNLIVRIGGFSARFIELNPVVQNEILLRTTYDN